MSSVFNPDEGLYIINGSVNITNDLEVGGEISFQGPLTIHDTSNFTIDNPVYGEAALNVAGGAIIKGNLYVMGHIIALGDVITLGQLPDQVRSMIPPGSAIMDPDGNIINIDEV